MPLMAESVTVIFHLSLLKVSVGTFSQECDELEHHSSSSHRSSGEISEN